MRAAEGCASGTIAESSAEPDAAARAALPESDAAFAGNTPSEVETTGVGADESAGGIA